MTMMNLPVACSFQRKSRRYVDSVWNFDLIISIRISKHLVPLSTLNDDHDGDDDDDDDYGDHDDHDDDYDSHLVAVNHEGEGEWDDNSNHLLKKNYNL